MKNCDIKGLGFSMFCLIDYLGFRLIAQSKLPINENTLVYGSKNNGKVVLCSDKMMRIKMKSAAEKLNLKAHETGVSLNGRKLLYFPGDIEGHKGTDGNYYVNIFLLIFLFCLFIY